MIQGGRSSGRRQNPIISLRVSVVFWATPGGWVRCQATYCSSFRRILRVIPIDALLTNLRPSLGDLFAGFPCKIDRDVLFP